MSECPSRSWEQNTKNEERAHTPTDEEMLEELDAYGHLTWTVGFDNDDGDWLACFDFNVVNHPERGLLIAYHTVVNSDSGGFIDTLERLVVEEEAAPFNLPDYWTSIGMESGDDWSDDDIAEATRTNEKWNKALADEIKRSKTKEQTWTTSRTSEQSDS